ncbi:MAG: flagellar protein FlgN [Eubacterium sp.]|nr:flagellar protein FlgN [Eubacterium sp.]
MASLIEELITTLDEEERLYDGLIPIQERKIRAIVANNLDDINSISAEEQVIVDKLGNLENKRLRVNADMETVLGRKKGSMNLEDVIASLKNQPEEQKALKEIHDRLKKTIARIKDLNAQNKSLLEESIEMLEFNMNVIRSTRMNPGSSNYSSGATQVDMNESGTSSFDAKQ